MHDKWFGYILFFQLFLWGLPGSLVGAVGGLVAGGVYRSRAIGLADVEMPSFVTRTASAVAAVVSRLSPPPPAAAAAAAAVAAPAPAVRIPVGGGAGGGGAGGGLPVGVPVPAANRSLQRPPQPPPQPPPAATAQPDPEAVGTLKNMGFDEATAREALRRSGNNLVLATNLLLDH
eukprot:TRINITY_DN3194_c0_g1_i1.p2 TRINITY_DN3194_c0_g1~~TRINITY_DN3194_c0_g1_i1.p2  ORF type:complete len:186 (-),score=81.85 TRINITY_DN3194_c0_g1_i1:93-617(-)